MTSHPRVSSLSKFQVLHLSREHGTASWKGHVVCRVLSESSWWALLMFELSKSRKKIIVLQCIVWLHTVVLGNYKGRLKLLFSLDTTLGEIVESLLSSASKPVKKYNMFSLKGKYYFHILFLFSRIHGNYISWPYDNNQSKNQRLQPLKPYTTTSQNQVVSLGVTSKIPKKNCKNMQDFSSHFPNL